MGVSVGCGNKFDVDVGIVFSTLSTLEFGIYRSVLNAGLFRHKLVDMYSIVLYSTCSLLYSIVQYNVQTLLQLT